MTVRVGVSPSSPNQRRAGSLAKTMCPRPSATIIASSLGGRLTGTTGRARASCPASRPRCTWRTSTNSQTKNTRPMRIREISSICHRSRTLWCHCAVEGEGRAARYHSAVTVACAPAPPCRRLSAAISVISRMSANCRVALLTQPMARAIKGTFSLSFIMKPRSRSMKE